MAVETNWKNFLSEDSELPPDVSIRVKGDEEEEGQIFRAHKTLLAGVSPVFRKQFSGPMKDTMEVVEVKETTYEAFDTMVKFIYHNPPSGDPFNLHNIRCPQKLFELLALANKYQILGLATITSEALGRLTITRENMIFAATVSKNYKRIFEDVSTKLSLRCLKFLFDTTQGAGDICDLVEATEENFPGANLDIVRELISVRNATLLLPGIGFDFHSR